MRCGEVRIHPTVFVRCGFRDTKEEALKLRAKLKDSNHTAHYAKTEEGRYYVWREIIDWKLEKQLNKSKEMQK